MRYPQRRGKDEIEGNLKKLALAHLSLYVHCFVFLLLKSLFTYQMKQKRHVNFIFLQGKEGEIDKQDIYCYKVSTANISPLHLRGILHVTYIIN